MRFAHQYYGPLFSGGPLCFLRQRVLAEGVLKVCHELHQYRELVRLCSAVDALNAGLVLKAFSGRGGPGGCAPAPTHGPGPSVRSGHHGPHGVVLRGWGR